MSLKRQYPVNISQKVNTKDKMEAVFNIPKYPSIHQNHENK